MYTVSTSSHIHRVLVGTYIVHIYRYCPGVYCAAVFDMTNNSFGEQNPSGQHSVCVLKKTIRQDDCEDRWGRRGKEYVNVNRGCRSPVWS